MHSLLSSRSPQVRGAPRFAVDLSVGQAGERSRLVAVTPTCLRLVGDEAAAVCQVTRLLIVIRPTRATVDCATSRWQHQITQRR